MQTDTQLAMPGPETSQLLLNGPAGTPTTVLLAHGAGAGMHTPFMKFGQGLIRDDADALNPHRVDLRRPSTECFTYGPFLIRLTLHGFSERQWANRGRAEPLGSMWPWKSSAAQERAR